MAYTEIHPIKVTLGKAIDYICNKEKTENGLWISTHNCQHRTAEYEFGFTRKSMNSNVENLAFHAIQSFKKGEVTAEQAHEIGLETMKRMLDDQYEFVLSTHVDKACIHNHIIINSVNFHNGKAFSTEHDRKFSPAWKELKKYSDEITAERGLSVIENSKGKGVSHYEWELKQTGQSWKQKLKIIIDETVKASKSFDDFLDKMRAEGIEVKYEDYVKKSGKCLGFKMPGQKYFIYSQKFGWYYEEAQLRKRIERNITRKSEYKAKQITNPDNRVKEFFNLYEDKFNSFGMQRWGKIQNLKTGFKTIAYLNENGFKNAEDFFSKYEGLNERKLQNSEKINALESKLKFNKYRLKYLKIYRQYKPISEQYKKAVFQDKYFRKHEDELLLFQEAVEELKKTEKSKVLPNAAVLSKEIQSLSEQKNKLYIDNKAIDAKLREYDSVKKNLEKIIEDSVFREEHNQRESSKEKRRENDIQI